jgi:aldose 1-epimerase
MEMVDIQTFRLENTTGAYAEVTNYGATLLSVVVPDKSGRLENVILRYKRIEEYLSDPFYTGSTVGRIANRIARAQFELNGKTYQLDKNDGKNTNHGGFTGFNSRLFDYQANDHQVIFKYRSANGEGGFPGNLFLSVGYSFSDDNELRIEYKAVSDMETPFNPTNHAYFNLTGGRENILNHELKIHADRYLETDNEYIPTGKILPISGSTFDFRDYRKLFPAINTYFISNSEATIKHLASVREFSSGRKLDVYSSMPGIQVYTGDFLADPYRPLAGIALEAQFFPDFLNQKHFSACMLYPDTEINHCIRFRFGIL